jgi:YHS domain-containing protein
MKEPKKKTKTPEAPVCDCKLDSMVKLSADWQGRTIYFCKEHQQFKKESKAR